MAVPFKVSVCVFTPLEKAHPVRENSLTGFREVWYNFLKALMKYDAYLETGTVAYDN